MDGRSKLAVVVAAGLLLTGCTPAGEADVDATASQFQRLVTAKDWAGACGLLSEQARTGLESATARPCAQALAVLRLPAEEAGTVEVWGHNAGVMGQQALFLSRFTSGWRVIAAGCTPQGPDLPYQCVIGG